MGNLAYKYEEAGESRREEMLNGKIVLMSPRPTVDHNLVAGNIYTLFSIFLKGKKCTPFGDGTDVYLTDKDRTIPDGMVVCNPDIIKRNGVHGAPDLIVEVLSPGTARKDKGYKKDLYESCGVGEYWIVDAEGRSVEVYLLTEGRYALDNVYRVYRDYELEDMKEEEIADIQHEFSPALFPDMKVTVADVFERIR